MINETKLQRSWLVLISYRVSYRDSFCGGGVWAYSHQQLLYHWALPPVLFYAFYFETRFH